VFRCSLKIEKETFESTEILANNLCTGVGLQDVNAERTAEILPFHSIKHMASLGKIYPHHIMDTVVCNIVCFL